MSTVWVNLLGVLMMVAVAWWFWFAGRRSAVSVTDGQVEIRVAHGAYAPDRIAVRVGETTRIRFRREDPAPCAAMVQFEGLSISRELPVGEVVEVAVRYDEPGEYAFTCQMGMYRGHVVAT